MPKVAIVTGAASAQGIGFAVAEALANDGVQLVITDIDGDAVNARATALLAKGREVIACQHDVASEASWSDVFNAAVTRFGGCDILVNNAGIAILKSVDLISLVELRHLMDVNATGTFIGCQQALAMMRSQGRGGCIINISSVSALVGFRNNAGYGATKGAIRSMTKAVAVEAARDAIRCNSVHPGAIWTEIQLAARAEQPEAFGNTEAQIPLGRIGDPADVAHLVAFLASDKATYITGGEFVVDGGLTAMSRLGAD